MDGAAPVPEVVPEIPGLVLGARLGSGGFGVVWEAGRGDGAVDLAVKVAHGAGLAYRRRFEREAEALQRVGPPHVPALRETGFLEDGSPYIAMELLRGQTLGELIAGHQTPPPLPVVQAAADAVLASLVAVHAAGLVHRDLKPDNIFVRPDGSAAIMDFGLTRMAEAADLTRTGIVVGTSEYLAPEQLRGDPDVDLRADLYAFGAILYQLLCLRPPFVGDAASVQHGHLALRPMRPGLVRPLPAALEALTLDCLAKEPDRRPATASAVRDRLAQACAEPVAAHPAPRPFTAPGPGPQPVVLVAIESEGSSVALSDAVQRAGGWLARQRGRHYLAAFASPWAEDPLRAAHAAALQIVADEGGRAAVHLAQVTVVPRPGRAPVLTGEAIDRPESWLPEESWSGVHVGAELAGRVQSGDVAAPPLVGREAAARAMEASAARCFADGSPALFTIVGERGLGKTRMLDEAAACALRLAPGVRTFRLRCGDRAQPASELVRELGVPGPAGEALRDLAARGPVALLVDDGHRADDALLDAIEHATSGPSGARLWIALAALPSLVAEIRPRWGLRAEHHDLVELGPLDPADAAELAAHLLLPAEYPPLSALAQLADWSGGNPLHLTEAVRALERGGLVRRRAGAEGHYLATELLDGLPSSPVVEWLGIRALAELPAPVAACARLAAVLGPEFARDELERVQEAMERDGELVPAIDVGVGLGELDRAGLVRREENGERCRFRSALLREAIYQQLSPEERARLHRHALAAARGRAEALPHVARHAAACGETGEAADAFLALADAAHASHRDLEAEQCYTRVLALVSDGERRMRALAGRGRIRYRIDRLPQAIEDLAAARALAGERGDARAEADLLLDEATALDWMEAVAASSQRVEEARPLVEASGDDKLAVRLSVAIGRSHWRAGHAALAREVLDETAVTALRVGDDESRIISVLLGSAIRVGEGQSGEARAGFDEVIDRCVRSGDRLHLQAALICRSVLATADSLEDGLADLRRAIAIAREDGHPSNEGKACFNCAELLFWSGEESESLQLARRTKLLEERFSGRVLPRTSLLIARILAGRGEPAAAAELAWLRRHTDAGDWREGDHLLARALELHLAGGSPDDWEALVEPARSRLPPEEFLEVLYWRARSSATERGPILAEAEKLLDLCPLLRPRLARLTSEPDA